MIRNMKIAPGRPLIGHVHPIPKEIKAPMIEPLITENMHSPIVGWLVMD